MQQTRRPSSPTSPPLGFISHARADLDEVALLQQELQLRGVRVWRDVTSLPAGSYTEEQILEAIRYEIDLFLLYLTRRVLRRPFVWGVEVPAAIKRWKADPLFRVTPVFRDVTPDGLKRHCLRRGIGLLNAFNGPFVPLRGAVRTPEAILHGLQAAARDVLASTLSLRLTPIAADEAHRPRLCLRTFEYAPRPGPLDLDLNWVPFFADSSPGPEVWKRRLFPALRDVKDSLSTRLPSRTLHIAVQARLPAALAFGAMFPATADFDLLVEAGGATWSGGAPRPDFSPIRRTATAATGDPEVAVVQVAISRETGTATARTVAELSLSHRYAIRLEPHGGPSRESVRDEAEAVGIAYQIGDELRSLRDELGVRHVHLFAAMPAALAVFVGRHLNAISALTMYYTDGDTQYVPAYTLGGTSTGG